MRKTTWLRYGLGSALVAAATMAGVLVACGDDDNGGGVTPRPDSGTPDSQTPTPDGSTPPRDTGTDAPVAKTPAKIMLVHAATNLGPSNPSGAVRVCFSTAPANDAMNFQPTPFGALPTDAGAGAPFAGIQIGTGGPFPSSGANLETLNLRPYMMNAESLKARGIEGTDATTPRCPALINGTFDGGTLGPLVANEDYWQLADIPAGTLKSDKTYILAVLGCAGDADPLATAGKCGLAKPGEASDGGFYVPPGTPGVGNLSISVMEVDTSAVQATELGAQFIHLSPQYEAARTLQPAFGHIAPVVSSGDAGPEAGFAPITPTDAGVPYSQTPAPTQLARVVGITTALGFVAANGDVDPITPGSQFHQVRQALNNTGTTAAGGPHAGLSVQAVSTGSSAATPYIELGKSYTFILVGDPGGSGTKLIHFLAFPNVFTPPSL